MRSRVRTLSTLRAMLPLLEHGYLSGELSRIYPPPPGETEPLQCFCLIGAVAEVQGKLEPEPLWDGTGFKTTCGWSELAPGVMTALAETIRMQHPQLIGFDVPTTVWRYNDVICPANSVNPGGANADRMDIVRATIRRLEGASHE